MRYDKCKNDATILPTCSGQRYKTTIDEEYLNEGNVQLPSPTFLINFKYFHEEHYYA